jgi:phospholipid N-methyltransferase
MALNRFDFLIEAVKNWKQSGTITQSSPNLCKAMVAHLEPEKDKYVVEFGAGDGVITKYILEKLPPDGLLFSFEINDALYEQMKEIKDSRLVPIYDSAENLGIHLSNAGIDQVDSVISSIPFVVLPTELTISILEEAKKYLKPGSLFVQFNYSKILKGVYKSVFHNYTSKYVLMNTPPAFVFKCIKK